MGVSVGQLSVKDLRRILVAVLALAQALMPVPAVQAPAMAQGASVARPGSASIRTPDFDESVQWYQDVLGFRHLSTRNLVQERVALLERSGFLLEITEIDHPMQPSPHQDPDRTAATRVPVISLLVPDVDEEVARLRERGVDILDEPRDELEGGYRVAQIRDNGRHRIELREPLAFNPVGR